MPVIERNASEGLSSRAFRIVRGDYAFGTDGGAVGTIALMGSTAIPSGATILGGWLEVTTAVTSGGAATVAIQVEGAGDIVAAAAGLGRALVDDRAQVGHPGLHRRDDGPDDGRPRHLGCDRDRGTHRGRIQGRPRHRRPGRVGRPPRKGTSTMPASPIGTVNLAKDRNRVTVDADLNEVAPDSSEAAFVYNRSDLDRVRARREELAPRDEVARVQRDSRKRALADAERRAAAAKAEAEQLRELVEADESDEAPARKGK
jgi:hypothetical protein